jgi:hypothetical protein
MGVHLQADGSFWQGNDGAASLDALDDGDGSVERIAAVVA